jgi:hypothetical protein
MGKVTAEIKLADEVWIATALLHREHPEASDFTLREIVARMVREGFGERKGIYPHVSSHCVANRPGSTGNYRTLFETAPARRRLYRTGEPLLACHPLLEILCTYDWNYKQASATTNVH